MNANKKAKVYNVFFDTEFTKFKTLKDEPKLISIGCVDQNGREFYAELTDTHQASDCSDFVLQVVVPLLSSIPDICARHPDARMFEQQLAHRLSKWVSEIDGEVVFKTDSPSYDWPFVEYLFTFYGCWPENLRRKCSGMIFDNPNIGFRYDCGMHEYWKGNARFQHNALVDAHSLYFSWKYAIRRAIR